MAERNVIGWFTVNGKHVPIYEDSGYSKRVDNKNENNKDIKFEDYSDFLYQNTKLPKEEAHDIAVDYWNKGLSKYEALNKALTNDRVKQEEDKKARQIAQNKEQADKLNGKKSIPVLQLGKTLAYPGGPDECYNKLYGSRQYSAYYKPLNKIRVNKDGVEFGIVGKSVKGKYGQGGYIGYKIDADKLFWITKFEPTQSTLARKYVSEDLKKPNEEFWELLGKVNDLRGGD